MSTTSNKMITAQNSSRAGDIKLYLDMAAEMSKIDRKNHHQVTAKGVPLVYDLSITVSSPLVSNLQWDASGTKTPPALFCTGTVLTAPNNWQTRNAVRMAHFTREDLRREAGVKKGSIGRYAKTLRCNLDADMWDIEYNPAANPGPAMNKRLYAMKTVTPFSITGAGVSGDVFVGGTWDYTQVAQVTEGDANLADPFYMNVCESHEAIAPGPYTYIGLLQAYNQRRQTTLDDSTLTSGGDTQFINNESPFFRIPEQDVSEDEYVQITLDEQDEPPYDRTIGADVALADSKVAQPQEIFQNTVFQAESRMRIQAPLGLVQINLADTIAGTNAAESFLQSWVVEVECHGTYEM